MAARWKGRRERKRLELENPAYSNTFQPHTTTHVLPDAIDGTDVHITTGLELIESTQPTPLVAEPEEKDSIVKNLLLAVVHELFDDYDVDGSGKIGNFDELQQLSTNVRHTPTQDTHITA